MGLAVEGDRHQVICLTPVKNEAWILDRFLQCATVWADHIIIADQQSTDGSREIASHYSKVRLIDNPTLEFNEPERQRLLIAAAREIPGSKVLIGLDADEILTANVIYELEWQRVLRSQPGTLLTFQKVALKPDLSSYWVELDRDYFGFVDDGSPHMGKKIHSPRVPVPVEAPTLHLKAIKILHYQYTDWRRMESKQRWYQCWERLHQTELRPVQVYRQYHHMYHQMAKTSVMVPLEWLNGYQQRGIDMTRVFKDRQFWWDRAVVDLLAKYGASTFRRCDIWAIDWSQFFQGTGMEVDVDRYRDPRSYLDRLFHDWLKLTQPYHRWLLVRLVDRFLRLLGW
jgi:glycosyltransferase involved in cell wall biosynthesis